MFFVFLLYGVLSEYDLLEKASREGFFYRQVAIEDVAACPRDGFCLTVEGVTYHFRRLERSDVRFGAVSGGYTITLTPDPAFSAYRLFVRDADTVRRIEMTTRTATVRDPGTIVSLQIVAVGAAGPVVVWQKEVRSAPFPEWKGDFISSVNAIRKKAGAPPLSADESLRPAARKALERIRGGVVVHYDGREGSIMHSGLRVAPIGENLFIAATVERAWLMMISSPTHLFNILDPSFRRCWVEQDVPSAGGMVRGAMLFAGPRQ